MRTRIALGLAVVALLAAALRLSSSPDGRARRAPTPATRTDLVQPPPAPPSPPVEPTGEEGLSAIVEDPMGLPLDGVRAYLIPEDRSIAEATGPLTDAQVYEAHARTETSGRLLFSSPRPGPKFLILLHPGYALHLTRTEAPQGRSVDLGRIRMAPSPPFQGSVVDSEGRPVPGAVVAVVPFPDCADLYLLARIGSDGRFLFEAGPGEVFSAAAAAPGLQTETCELAPSRKEHRFVLASLASIRGLVRQQDGLSPAHAFRLQLLRVTPDGRFRELIADAAIESEDGTYNLADLGPGRYELRFRGQGASVVRPITIGEGKAPSADVTLVEEGLATGIVVDDSTGAPISGAIVSHSEMPELYSARTDAHGEFRLALPAGKQVLMVLHPDYAAGVSQEIDLAPKAEARTGTLRLGKGVRLIVTVQRAGSPREGAPVFLMGYTQDWLRGGRSTDARGEAVFEHVPSGKYTLWQGDASHQANLRVLELGATGEERVTLSEQGASSASGRLSLGPRREPLANALVQLVLLENGRTAVESVRTGPGGEFRLDRPEGAGEGIVLATIPTQEGAATWACRIPQGTQEGLDLAVDDRELRVVIRDGKTGRPLSGAEVQLFSHRGFEGLPLVTPCWMSALATVRTEDGVILRYLPAEGGILSVRQPGFAPWTREVLPGETEVRVDLGGAAGGAIEVQTRTQEDVPVKALVIVEDWNGVPILSSYTDAAGQARFEGIPAGRYRVAAEAGESVFVRVEVDVQDGSTASALVRCLDSDR